MDTVLDAATGLARELADPVRLGALQVLAVEGPHTMSQLAEALRVSPPRLGNHLLRLREAGLVAVEHTGRHAVYRLAEPELAAVLTTLFRHAARQTEEGRAARQTEEGRAARQSEEGHAARQDEEGHEKGDRERAATEPGSQEGYARTCYDHAAGRLGVTLFATLVERGALTPPDGASAELTLGPNRQALADLGVDPAALNPGRRKLATACLDRTYRLPHLGGDLGRAILDAWLERGLVARTEGSRALKVTDKGRRDLKALV